MDEAFARSTVPPAPGDVMRVAGNDGSGDTGHAARSLRSHRLSALSPSLFTPDKVATNITVTVHLIIQVVLG
jgi:hypothetical protein